MDLKVLAVFFYFLQNSVSQKLCFLLQSSAWEASGWWQHFSLTWAPSFPTTHLQTWNMEKIEFSDNFAKIFFIELTFPRAAMWQDIVCCHFRPASETLLQIWTQDQLRCYQRWKEHCQSSVRSDWFLTDHPWCPPWCPGGKCLQISWHGSRDSPHSAVFFVFFWCRTWQDCCCCCCSVSLCCCCCWMLLMILQVFWNENLRVWRGKSETEICILPVKNEFYSHLISEALSASWNNAHECHVLGHVLTEPGEGGGTRGVDLAPWPQTLISAGLSLLHLLSCYMNSL